MFIAEMPYFSLVRGGSIIESGNFDTIVNLTDQSLLL